MRAMYSYVLHATPHRAHAKVLRVLTARHIRFLYSSIIMWLLNFDLSTERMFAGSLPLQLGR